jgi:hypothetical protein
MAGNGVSDPKPIAAKPMAVERRHSGSRHVTHAQATPQDLRPAIDGGATFWPREIWSGADMVPIWLASAH